MAKQLPFRLILASASRGRRELLEMAGYPFEVQPANIDEPTGEGWTDPRSLVHHISWLKAAAMAPRFADGVIIAADTLGWIDGRPIGKPADEADARRIITTLSGREHELWTGVCLWRRPDNMQFCWQEVSKVFMRAMASAEVETYLKTRLWQGCAGAYAVELEGDPYVYVASGSTSNVIGLPMESLEIVLGWFSVGNALPSLEG